MIPFHPHYLPLPARDCKHRREFTEPAADLVIHLPTGTSSTSVHNRNHTTEPLTLNAFNSLDRTAMAASIRRYAPDLLVRMNGSIAKVQSTQVLRQGDPFSPLSSP